MNKIKVLHILPNFGPGGAERLVVDLMETIDKERFEVAAVSLYPESGTILEREIRDKGLQVYFLNKHRGLDLRMIPQIYRLFRNFRPDVVHTYRYVQRYTLLPTILCRIPVRIHTVCTVAQHEVDQLGKLVHWIAFRFGGVLPVSLCQAVDESVRAVYGRNIHTAVIIGGIKTARFRYERQGQDVSNQLGQSLILVHIGRFAPEKNHRLAIEAFAIAVRELPALKLWFVGEGEERPAIEELVSEKKLDQVVSFLGLRSDVPDILRKSDILISSSKYEALSGVVLEAMAAGLPVVATAVGGVPEVVQDGVTGFLVLPDDPQSMAEAILRLARDHDLRQRMGKAAQERVLKYFDISRTAREYEALYLKLLEERGRM